MKSRTCLIPLLAAMTALAPAGCSRDNHRQSGQPVKVAAGIPPVADIVRRIGGDHVEVRSILPAQASPHSYSPTTKQLVWVESAHLAVLLETPFEQVLADKLGGAVESLHILRPAGGLPAGLAQADHDGHDGHDEHDDHDGHDQQDHQGHDHHDHHGHDHGDGDPHLWLSPRAMRDTIAPAIAAELSELAPEFADVFQANLKALQQQLTELDQRIAEQLASLTGRTFYTYHAAFGHFAQAYDLKQKAIEIGGRSPSQRRVNELIAQARADDVQVIFVQKQFSAPAATTIAQAIDGVVVELDPLSGDYIEMMTDLAKKLETNLAGRGEDD